MKAWQAEKEQSVIPLAVHPDVSYAGKRWDGQEGSPVIGTLSAVAGRGIFSEAGEAWSSPLCSLGSP